MDVGGKERPPDCAQSFLLLLFFNFDLVHTYFLV